MALKVHHRLKPKQGFAHFFHLGFVAVLPILVFILVRIDLVSVALAIILLSKWRIFAVRPRHWVAHVRTNAVDIIFSLSMLAFITSTDAMSVQLLWVFVYEIWVLYIKPGINAVMVSLQALIAQLAGMIALFLTYPETPLIVYIIVSGVIAYFSARHFFNSFEESNYNAYSWSWTLFVTALVWLTGHWLLFYGPIAQVALLVSVIGYSLASLYYLSETDKLSKLVQRQVVFIMLTVVALILVLSKWTIQSI